MNREHDGGGKCHQRDFSEEEDTVNQVLKEILDTNCWIKAGKALLEGKGDEQRLSDNSQN